MMWPFRTAATRDSYPEDEAPKDEPVVIDTKRYDINGGLLDMQVLHVCTPPTQEDLSRQDKHAKLQKGDRWTCKTCAKVYYRWDTIWAPSKPDGASEKRSAAK